MSNARWTEVCIFIDRIEASREQDFSLALENAKALLESVCKEICETYGVELPRQSNMSYIVKSCLGALGFTNTDDAKKISSSLAFVGEKIGKIRNEICSTSHGRTVEELRKINLMFDDLTKDFLFDIIQTIIILLIRTFELRQDSQSKKEISNEKNKEFDDFLDEMYGEFSIGIYSYPASQILFSVDSEAYQYERKNFEENDVNEG